MESLGLKQRNHSGPTGSIRPRAVNDDNVSDACRGFRLSDGPRVKHRCQKESCNCNQNSSECLRDFHIFFFRRVKIEGMKYPARADAVVLKRFATGPAYTTLTVTSTLLRVALEYAQVSPCVAFTMAWAISRSKPGRLTFSRARRK